jgi:CDP-glucose 4,6-dehydratase
VGWVVERLHRAWGRSGGWVPQPGDHPHEATLLVLDAAKATSRLGWHPRFDVERAVESVADWHRRAAAGEDPRELCREAIAAYEAQR